LAFVAITISAMRGPLFAAAVLVAAVLLDSSLYDNRYLKCGHADGWRNLGVPLGQVKRACRRLARRRDYATFWCLD